MRIASTAATSVDQLTRHNKEPIDIYDNRMIDAALSDLAWFAGKIKVVAAGPVGGLLALAPELERFLADRDRNPQRSFEMGLKLYVKFTGLLIGYAIGMVLVDAAVWSLPAWTVGSIVAGIGGAAYDFARNGSHFREIGQELSTAGAGIADLGARLAIVFGAISHAAERVALPLHMTIEDFFGHDRRFLDPIGPLRAAAANRRYAEGASNVVTRTTHSAWSERCVDGLCTRTYRQKPPRDDPWLFGGGGGGGGGGGAGGGPRPQRPPPAELVGGVTVDPKPVASRRDPDAQGAAALKARPSTANPAIREIP